MPPPRRHQTERDLLTLQRLMLSTLTQPLTVGDDLAPRWRDGRSMEEVAAAFIKPNDRLTAFERLQIYARSYWFRLIDCVYDDAPGLRAVLGEKKFSALARAYLAKYPSRSFTLRNLCARLPQFIEEEPRWTTPRTRLAHAMARFEWAQTVAFDGEARPAITRDEIADVPPHRLRLALQPHISLLGLAWPLDDYVLAVKKRAASRDAASNTPDGLRRPRARKLLSLPPRRRVFLVVHRHDQQLLYKRLDAPAFRILEALAAGRTLPQAVAAAGRGVKPEQVREWFATWMELGWFCRR